MVRFSNSFHVRCLNILLGVYDVIAGLLLVKFALALAMLFMGPTSIALLIVFIASNRIFTEVSSFNVNTAC